MQKRFFCVVSQMVPDKFLSRLRDFFDPVITLPPEYSLPTPVNSHPDMIMCCLHDKLFLSEQYYLENKALIDQISSLSGLAAAPTDDIRTHVYPGDVSYNIGIGSNFIICREDAVSRSVINYSLCHGDTLVSVRQGYSACSCLITDSAVLTADCGIIIALNKHKIPSVQLNANGILLPGYNEGFIGGASGYFDKKIFIFGNAANLQCFAELSAFAQSAGYTIISLSNDQSDAVFDYGGIKIFEIK